jgi:hypothetical protein
MRVALCILLLIGLGVPGIAASPARAAAPGTPAHAERAAPARAIPTPVPPRGYTGVPSVPLAPLVYRDLAGTNLSGITLGRISQTANIRRGPDRTAPVDRVWRAGRRVLIYDRAVTGGETWYQVGRYPDPDLYVHSSLVAMGEPLRLPTATWSGSPIPISPPVGEPRVGYASAGRWLDVNLTQQTLIAYDDTEPLLLAQIASGKAGYETAVGTWPVFYRLVRQDMDGGGSGPRDPYYNLKDVPWVQYFYVSGQALHGTYWHDNFGTPMSHGCVNLSIPNAQWLYLWAGQNAPVRVHY